MPHSPLTLEDLLDLNDPIDRQIAKLDLTVDQLRSTRDSSAFGSMGVAGHATNLDALRAAASGQPADRGDENNIVSNRTSFWGNLGHLQNISGGRIAHEDVFDQSTGQLRTDLLGTKALQLFPGLVLPDFLKPLPTAEPEPLPTADVSGEMIQDKQTFSTLFKESLTAQVEQTGTGRADLVRDTS